MPRDCFDIRVAFQTFNARNIENLKIFIIPENSSIDIKIVYRPIILNIGWSTS